MEGDRKRDKAKFISDSRRKAIISIAIGIVVLSYIYMYLYSIHIANVMLSYVFIGKCFTVIKGEHIEVRFKINFLNIL